MREGKLYRTLRKFAKLPRPDEIWGEAVTNKWTPRLIYFYGKLVFGEAMSHLTFPKSILDTILLFLVLFEIKDVAPDWVIVIIGAVGVIAILIIGHILTVMGFIKQQTQLQVSQTPDMIEIRDNIRTLIKERSQTKKQNNEST